MFNLFVENNNKLALNMEARIKIESRKVFFNKYLVRIEYVPSRSHD